MKKSLFLHTMLAALALIVLACADEADTSKLMLSGNHISTSTDRVSLPGDGGTESVSVRANCRWTISSDADWLACTPASGSGSATVTLTAPYNPSVTGQRTATVRLAAADGLRRDIYVFQEARATSLTLNPTSLTFDAPAATKTIALVGNASWTASSDAEWVTLDMMEGSGNAELRVACADNTTAAERTAVVTISTQRSSLECRITQHAGQRPQVSATEATQVERELISVAATVESVFPLSAVGFCYSSTNPEPTLSDSFQPAADASAGRHTATLSGLESYTVYYIRAYATNAVGTTFGPVVSVTTKGSAPGSDDNPKPNV